MAAKSAANHALDECATWAQKAEALATYTKQARDTELRELADRIQTRAIRRCGELLAAIEPGPAGRPKSEGCAPLISRSQAARRRSVTRPRWPLPRGACQVEAVRDPVVLDHLEHATGIAGVRRRLGGDQLARCRSVLGAHEEERGTAMVGDRRQRRAGRAEALGRE